LRGRKLSLLIVTKYDFTQMLNKCCHVKIILIDKGSDYWF